MMLRIIERSTSPGCMEQLPGNLFVDFGNEHDYRAAVLSQTQHVLKFELLGGLLKPEDTALHRNNQFTDHSKRLFRTGRLFWN